MTGQDALFEAISRDLLRRKSDASAGKVRGRETYFWCPLHPDGDGKAPHSPSLRLNPQKRAWYCDPCGQGGALTDLAQRLGIDIGDDSGILAVYDYRDADGKLWGQVVRKPGKDFPVRRPDGKGGWIWDWKGLRRTLYGLPGLLAACADAWVFVVEGEKDADRLGSLGLVATTNPGGAKKWRVAYSETLQGRKVAIIPDHDAAGLEHAQLVAQSLEGRARDVRIVRLPGQGPAEDVSDWLNRGGTAEELVAMVDDTLPSDIAGKPLGLLSAPDRGETVPTTLADVESAFRKWLLMPDMGALRFVLALVAGHRLSGDPLWGFLVAPPSGAKTEIIRALEDVPGVFPLSELTARTFASGLQNDKRDPSLLSRLTDDILVLKDFTTILTIYREERQAILAQLREIYDGRFDKAWGSGKEVHWTGRLGFIAGVTPIIDQYHAVHQVLGERFTLYRMPQPDRRDTALKALRTRGRETAMRSELREVAVRFLGCLDCSNPPSLPTAFEERLAALADFTARARSGVIRDRGSRELTLAPDPEGPARLVKQLAQLTVGHALICNSPQVREENFSFVRKVALDCLPQLRLRVIETLRASDGFLTTGKVAEAVRYPTPTARRYLEDLAALGIVEASKGGRGHADEWQLTQETRGLLGIVQTVSAESESDRREATFPAMSEGRIRDSGQLPDADTLPSDDGRRVYMIALGEELGFPNVPDLLPAGREWYERAARYFSDADILRAVEVLEGLAAGVAQ